jgi:hypothetical protein
MENEHKQKSEAETLAKELTLAEIIRSNMKESLRDQIIGNKLNLMLEEHEKSIDRTAKCRICAQIFATDIDLDWHFTEVHENLIRKLNTDELEYDYSCCCCAVEHSNADDLIRHLMTYENQTNFNCRSCTKLIFKDFESFFTHAKHHAIAKPYECLKCLRRFHLNQTFKDHIKTHFFLGYRCKEPGCLQKFKLKSKYNAHRKEVHNIRKEPTESEMTICNVNNNLIKQVNLLIIFI